MTFQHDGQEHVVECDWVLGNVAPWVMQILLGDHPGPRPEGSQLQVDMVLERLPRLRSGVSPPMAFAGTMHIAESYDQLQQAFLEAQEGFIPEVPPGELLCHSLTDPSVLGALAMEGKHVFTYFGVQTPARLFSGHVDAQRDETVLRVLDAINVYLEEPLETLVTLDQERQPLLDREGAAGRRGAAGDAGRTHLPRTPVVALGARTGPASRPRRSGGACTPRCRTCCCAVQARSAVVRSPASAVTTPRWRCSRPPAPRTEHPD